MTDDKKMRAIEIIKNLINVIGSSVGVIMIAVGLVMFIGAFLKLYVFNLELGANFRAYNCDQIIDAPYTNPKMIDDGSVTQDQLSKKDRMDKYNQCVKREDKREYGRFINEKKHMMIDGFTFFIVGLPILIFYMRRSKK